MLGDLKVDFWHKRKNIANPDETWNLGSEAKPNILLRDIMHPFVVVWEAAIKTHILGPAKRRGLKLLKLDSQSAAPSG